MSYLTLQEASVEETHLPTLSTAGLVTLPREVLSVTSSVSLMSTFFFSRKRKIKLNLLGGKKNPADNPQGGFLILCSCFHLLRLLGFLCLGNLDIKGKSE